MKLFGSIPVVRPILAALTVTLTLCSAAAGGELSVSWVNSDGNIITTMSLDLQDLDALPQSEITTSTPWNEGAHLFAGPKISDLSRLSGLDVHLAEIRALNDYSVEVPKEDWETYGIILATRIDGAPPRIYEKGPFWLMYPVDSIPAPLPQKYISRMIWQIESIEFHVD